MMRKHYQELMLELEILSEKDILTASQETEPKLDNGIGDFYEQEF